MLFKLMIDACNSNNPSLAVFQPDIAQNLGAMLRLTACFGVSINIIEPCGFPFSQKVLRRSAMDYMDFAKINHHTSYKNFREKTPGRVILLTTKAKKSIWEHSFENNDTLLVGRESAGVPKYVADDSDYCLKIPIIDRARSLNVVTAAAIALAEVLRQTKSTSDLH